MMVEQHFEFLPKMLEFFYAVELTAEGSQVCLPVTNGNNRLIIIFIAHQLGLVDHRTTIHHRLHAGQRVDRVASECLLEEAKAPVGSKLGVSCHQKIQSYGLVETSGHSPHEIPQDKLVFILSWAIITVEVDSGLPKPIVLEEVVEEGHDRIWSLTDEVGLVNQKVHLSRNTLTVNPK